MGNKSSRKKFENEYIQGGMLGKGAFATVYSARLKSEPSKIYAAKVIAKEHVSKKELRDSRDEIEIMRTLNHANVVSLREVFDSKKRLVLVMEYCSGGHLLQRIIKMKFYTEGDASRVIRQITSAVQHMHQLGVVHRDLKPENILYATPDANSAIKITDFGLSKYLPQGVKQSMTAACGTPSYVAPEVVMRKPEGYNNKCDLWSVGVIMYVLLSGYPPFFGKKLGTLLARIKSAKYDFGPKPFANVSDDAKQIIRELLVVDPEKRLSATELLRKRWVSDRRFSKQIDLHNLESAQVHLKTYHNRRRFKRAIKLFAALDTLYKVAKGEKKYVLICGQRQFIDVEKVRSETRTRSGYATPSPKEDSANGKSLMLDGESTKLAVLETPIDSLISAPTRARAVAKYNKRTARRPRSHAREKISFQPGAAGGIAVHFNQTGI